MEKLIKASLGEEGCKREIIPYRENKTNYTGYACTVEFSSATNTSDCIVLFIVGSHQNVLSALHLQTVTANNFIQTEQHQGI